MNQERIQLLSRQLEERQSTTMNNLANRAVNGGLDDYFTAPDYARHCAHELRRHIPEANLIVEPSAGCGDLVLAALEAYGPAQPYWAGDLEPKEAEGGEAIEIHQGSFFDVDHDFSGAVVFGNPPFGFACNLAVRFFNHCADLGVDVIAFIIPRTFRKSSIQNKLNASFELLFDEDTPANSFYIPQAGTYRNVPCCFQIWRRTASERPRIDEITSSEVFDFVSKQEAEHAVRRVGGRAGKWLEGTDHSESSTYFLKAKKGQKRNLRTALKKLDLDAVATQTVGVRSISKGELVKGINDALSTKKD